MAIPRYEACILFYFTDFTITLSDSLAGVSDDKLIFWSTLVVIDRYYMNSKARSIFTVFLVLWSWLYSQSQMTAGKERYRSTLRSLRCRSCHVTMMM